MKDSTATLITIGTMGVVTVGTIILSAISCRKTKKFEEEKKREVEELDLDNEIINSTIKNPILDSNERAMAYRYISSLYSDALHANDRETFDKRMDKVLNRIEILNSEKEEDIEALLLLYSEDRARNQALADEQRQKQHELDMMRYKADSEVDKVRLVSSAMTSTAQSIASIKKENNA